MKYSVGLLSLAIAFSAIAPPVEAQQIRSVQFSYPQILSSRAVGNTHFITLNTGAYQPLSYLEIMPMSNVVELSRGNILVTDRYERVINTDITRAGGGIRINFERPIPPRTTLRIAMDDVYTAPRTNARVYKYRVYGRHIGFNQNITYGIASINTY